MMVAVARTHIGWMLGFLACMLVVSAAASALSDPLPSWEESQAKRQILDFVARVTARGGAHFVPETQRIAVFDNDGTLWAEKPIYVQAQFVIDRIRSLAPQHPEWKDKEPFASILKGDMKGIAKSGESGIAAVMAATHAGMTTDEFDKIAEDWISTAKHPTMGRLYTDLVYQPMLELLSYLRANGFKTFIVSGGGIEFMRPWTERVYGIPPEQVIGSSGGLKFEMHDGKPLIVKLPTLVLNDDKDGKPVGIERHIGRRPVAAFGNSDGDLQMLEWTCDAPATRLCLLVHHTDAEREWAYDRSSRVGKLDKALDEATAKGWTVVDMKHDWKTIYPKEVKP
jgi:phosphoserine phosphatase